MATVTVTLLSEGQKIGELYRLVSVDVRKEVNRIPQASVVLLDGSAARRKFEMSDAAYFEPAKQLKIEAEYTGVSGSKATLFTGNVVRHRIQADAKSSYLIIEAKDAAFKLTTARKSALYAEKSDADVIGQLVKDAGLKSGTIDATKPAHKQMVQYNSTAWDFIVTRAEANGLCVVADDGEVSARKVAVQGQAKHTFDYGLSEIYEIEFEADGRDQVAEVKASGWDVKEQKTTAPSAAKAFALSQGNLDGKKLAGTLAAAACTLSHPVPLELDELQAWADGRLMRSRMSMLRGRVATRGFGGVKLLDVMQIDGVGKRFNGKTLVTGICHQIDAAGWRTDLQFGLAARAFSREEGVNDAPAAGLLPGVGGLQIGVVDKFEEDPDKEFRVKVLVPGLDAKDGVLWARLAAPDAGKNRGWFFRPETGDEVVLGFFNDDPRQAVILGGLYSSKNTPPEKFSKVEEKNPKKALVTKGGTTFGFVDEDKAQVFIETKGGAKLVIDDDKKSIALVDQNGNELTMDDKGITLKTGKDFKVDAGGNVEIKGSKVDVK